MRLRDLRKQKGWTMKQLGEMVDVSESTISLYENGKREPSFETLLKLGEILGVSVDYLLGNSPAQEESQKEKPIAENSDELIAFYGVVKDHLDEDDKQDIINFIRFKAEMKKQNSEE